MDLVALPAVHRVLLTIARGIIISGVDDCPLGSALGSCALHQPPPPPNEKRLNGPDHLFRNAIFYLLQVFLFYVLAEMAKLSQRPFHC